MCFPIVLDDDDPSSDVIHQIGDYGASTVYRLPWQTTVHMSTGLCGSEPYIAPEQFLNKRERILLAPRALTG